MNLINIKNVDFKKAIEVLIEEYEIYDIRRDIYISYWKTNEHRNQGEATAYIPTRDTLEEIMYEAKKLLDFNAYACVEVLCKDEDYDETLYHYDGIEEKILSY